MLAICLDRTPLVEVAALDDLYLDVTNQQEGTPDRLADDLRSQVRGEVDLSVSIGIGSSKMVAAVATDAAKPGRRIVVPSGEERAYLAPWPAQVLPGVGPKVAARLQRLNVLRVAELADVPLPLLCALFGNQGRLLHDQALRDRSAPGRTSSTAAVGEPLHQLRSSHGRTGLSAGDARSPRRACRCLVALP